MSKVAERYEELMNIIRESSVYCNDGDWRGMITEMDAHNLVLGEMADILLAHNAKQGKYAKGLCAHCGESQGLAKIKFGSHWVSVHPDCAYDLFKKARDWVGIEVARGTVQH